MPYHVVAVSGGYKVQSENGTYLSNKPLSKKKAEKQRIAATLSYLRGEGKLAKRK
jgi:hypothetical protein